MSVFQANATKTAAKSVVIYIAENMRSKTYYVLERVAAVPDVSIEYHVVHVVALNTISRYETTSFYRLKSEEFTFTAVVGARALYAFEDRKDGPVLVCGLGRKPIKLTRRNVNDYAFEMDGADLRVIPLTVEVAESG